MKEYQSETTLPDTGWDPDQQANDPLLVTVAEAGRLLSFGRTHIFELLAQNLLQRRKVGRATRITMDSVRNVAKSGAESIPYRQRIAQNYIPRRRPRHSAT